MEEEVNIKQKIKDRNRLTKRKHTITEVCVGEIRDKMRRTDSEMSSSLSSSLETIFPTVHEPPSIRACLNNKFSDSRFTFLLDVGSSVLGLEVRDNKDLTDSVE